MRIHTDAKWTAFDKKGGEAFTVGPNQRLPSVLDCSARLVRLLRRSSRRKERLRSLLSARRRAIRFQAIQIVDECWAGVDVPGVDLQQAGSRVQHRLAVVAGHDAAHADDRQRGARGEEAYDLASSGAKWSSAEATDLGDDTLVSGNTVPAERGVRCDQALSPRVAAHLEEVLQCRLGQVGSNLDEDRDRWIAVGESP